MFIHTHTIQKELTELAQTDKTLWEKIRDKILEIIGRIRDSYKSLSGASKTAQVLRETMESLDEIEQLFYEGIVEAGERARTAAVTRMNSENMQVTSEKKYSEAMPEVIEIQPNSELAEMIDSAKGKNTMPFAII